MIYTHNDHPAPKKKPRRARPPDQAPTEYTPPLLPNRSQHSLSASPPIATNMSMPGSFPLAGTNSTTMTVPPPLGSGGLRQVPNPFTTMAGPTKPGMYLVKAPEMPHRVSGRSGVSGGVNAIADIPVSGSTLDQTLNPTSNPNPAVSTPLMAPGKGISLVLPSSFPKPPPIQMPAMQQPPKFVPVPEPAWEKEKQAANGGRSEAERFKEMVLLGIGAGAGVEELGEETQGERPKRKKKKRRRDIIPTTVPEEPAGSELTARPLAAQGSRTRLRASPPVPPAQARAEVPTVEEDEALLQQQRQDTRRRRRRTMRSAVVLEDGQGGGGRGLTRGASMRRRNVWDGQSSGVLGL